MRLEGTILSYLLNATRLASIYNTQQSAVKRAPLWVVGKRKLRDCDEVRLP